MCPCAACVCVCAHVHRLCLATNAMRSGAGTRFQQCACAELHLADPVNHSNAPALSRSAPPPLHTGEVGGPTLVTPQVP